MIQNNQYRGRDKPSRRLAAWLARRAEAAGARLFRENDAVARSHGWQIEARNCGLGRVYRDPRFDRLASCPECHGSGSRQADKPCACCLGTGRVTLGRCAVPDRGELR